LNTLERVFFYVDEGALCLLASLKNGWRKLGSMVMQAFEVRELIDADSIERLTEAAVAAKLEGPSSEFAIFWSANLPPCEDDVVLVFWQQDHYSASEFRGSATGPKHYRILYKECKSWRLGWSHQIRPGAKLRVLVWQVSPTAAS
jgi:hypothetical protein